MDGYGRDNGILKYGDRPDRGRNPVADPLIAEIDESKGAWRAIGRIASERLSGLRRVATIESVGLSTAERTCPSGLAIRRDNGHRRAKPLRDETPPHGFGG